MRPLAAVVSFCALLLASQASASDFEDTIAVLVGEKPATPATAAAAVARLKKSCDSGQARSCRELGFMAFFGDVTQLNVPEAMTYLRRGCEEGDAFACRLMAQNAARGIGMHASTPDAQEFLVKACSLGDAPACAGAASSASDPARKSELAKAACDASVDQYKLCEVQVIGYSASVKANARANGVNCPDDPRWQARVDQAKLRCAAGKPSECIGAADESLQRCWGQGTEAVAQPLFELACTQGDADACFRAGGQAKALSDVESCTRGSAMACEAAAKRLSREYAGKPGVAAQTIALGKRACIGGRADACMLLGEYMQRQRSKESSIPWLERGCFWGSEIACRMVFSSERDQQGPRYVQTCKNIDAAACVVAGVMYQDGTRVGQIGGYFFPEFSGVKRDDGFAAALFRQGCEKKDQTACAYLGRAHLEGKGVPGDVKKGIATLQSACAGGSGTGCSFLAWTYAEGRQVPADAAKAATAAIRGCELESGRACYLAGVAYRQAMGIPQSLERAMGCFESGCTLGDSESCEQARRLREDLETFSKWRRKCEAGDHDLCRTVAVHQLRGDQTDRNVEEATRLLRADCDAGFFGARVGAFGATNAASCLWLVLLDTASDVGHLKPDEAQFMSKSCGGGDQLACDVSKCEGGATNECLSAARRFMSGLDFAPDGPATARHFGGNPHPARAEQLLGRACEVGDGEACLRAARLAAEEPVGNLRLAITLLESGCEKSSAQSCKEAGDAYSNGSGTQRDKPRSTALFKKGCDLGLPDACVAAKL